MPTLHNWHYIIIIPPRCSSPSNHQAYPLSCWTHWSADYFNVKVLWARARGPALAYVARLLLTVSRTKLGILPHLFGCRCVCFIELVRVTGPGPTVWCSDGLNLLALLMVVVVILWYLVVIVLLPSTLLYLPTLYCPGPKVYLSLFLHFRSLWAISLPSSCRIALSKG